MPFDAQSSFALYKVNLEFCFRFCALMREQAARSADAARDAFEACHAESETGLGRALGASDWTGLWAVSGDVPWTVLQHHIHAGRRFSETVIGNHMAFTTALQEAASAWQKSAAAALKETSAAMPLSTALRDFLQGALQFSTPPSTGRRARA